MNARISIHHHLMHIQHAFSTRSVQHIFMDFHTFSLFYWRFGGFVFQRFSSLKPNFYHKMCITKFTFANRSHNTNILLEKSRLFFRFVQNILIHTNFSNFFISFEILVKKYGTNLYRLFSF